MTATAKTPTVHEAWAAVMADVQAVKKTDKNTTQGYMFRGVDAVMNAAGPSFRTNRVAVVPEVVEVVHDERYKTSKGTEMRGVTVCIGWRVYGPAGDSFTGTSLGEASDSGDKAIPKAHSVAYRTFLLQALCLPTDEPDPDSESHERGAAKTETKPKSYSDMIPTKNGTLTAEQQKRLEDLTTSLIDGKHITPAQLASASKDAKPADLLARLERYSETVGAA